MKKALMICIFLFANVSTYSIAKVTPGDCLNYQVERLSYEEEQDYEVPELEIDQEGKLTSLSENRTKKEEGKLYRLYEGTSFQKCNQLSKLDNFILELGRDFLNCPNVDDANCESFEAFIKSQNNLIVSEAELSNIYIQDIEKSLSNLKNQIVKTELAQKITDRHKEIANNVSFSNDIILNKPSETMNVNMQSEKQTPKIDENKIEDVSNTMKSATFKKWLLDLWAHFLSLVIAFFNHLFT